jgi:DNA-binding transcriptional MerR regulator
MAKKVEYVQAEFTPAEAAAITGVSTETQRIWRHRKILPPSRSTKHRRFQASELGELLALKAFSDAGVPMESVKEAASIAVLPTWSFLANTIAEELGHIAPANRDRLTDRFVIVRGDRTMRGADLNALHTINDRCMVTHIFDCLTAAELIASRAPRPCMAVKVSQ